MDSGKTMLEPTEVEPRGGHRLWLRYSDGTAGEVDLSRLVGKGVFAAWNEPDPDARIAALGRCCHDDVVFRDEWAALIGIAMLGMHIGNCHQYMPGYTLEHTGDIRICRGEALVGWRATGPGGEPMEGFNHIQADPDGRIRRVTGFQAG